MTSPSLIPNLCTKSPSQTAENIIDLIRGRYSQLRSPNKYARCRAWDRGNRGRVDRHDMKAMLQNMNIQLSDAEVDAVFSKLRDPVHDYDTRSRNDGTSVSIPTLYKKLATEAVSQHDFNEQKPRHNTNPVGRSVESAAQSTRHSHVIDKMIEATKTAPQISSPVPKINITTAPTPSPNPKRRRLAALASNAMQIDARSPSYMNRKQRYNRPQMHSLAQSDKEKKLALVSARVGTRSQNWEKHRGTHFQLF